MKISLARLILNDSRMRSRLSKILKSKILEDDDVSPVAADVALDALIEGYVTVRLGGTHDLVGESVFPDREFTINTPNFKASSKEIHV